MGINERDSWPIGCDCFRRQTMGHIICCVFEITMFNKSEEELRQNRAFILWERLANIGEIMLAIKCGSQAFQPVGKSFSFNSQRLLIVPQVDTLSHRDKKSIALQFRAHDL